MADDFNKFPDPSHELPSPAESRAETLREQFAYGSPEGRELGTGFERAHDERELGRQFAHPAIADAQKLGHAFADPNSLDDARMGKLFEESNSSRKKKHVPVAERVHPPKNRKVLYIFVACVAVLFLAVFVLGWLPRHSRDEEIKKDAEQRSKADPVVETAVVKRAATGGGLVVPGTTDALTQAFVFARANGYLKQRFVDIGDRVREGQLLAIIDAPDLDQQVDQAREQVHQAESQLNQQRAQLALTKVTVERYRVLVAKGVFSRQQGDQTEADYASQQANVAAAERNVQAFEANLRHSLALQSYEHVTAPFSGIITQRNVDVGALISASGAAGGASAGPAPQGQSSTSGGSQQSGQTNNSGSSGSVSSAATPANSPGQGGPLFGIAQVQRLRILISVPEGYAASVHPGVQAKLNFQEFPNASFTGEVTRTSGSIDENTRTLLTEVQVDNHDGKLLPGMYAVATFPPTVGESPLLVPGDALTIRNDKSVVFAVADDKVRLVPVTLGRDYGPLIEVLSGLRDGDVIVTNVTDDVYDGAKVRVHSNSGQQQQQQQRPDQNQPPGGSTQYGNPGIADQNMQGKSSQQTQKGNGQKPKSGGTTRSKP
jgi:multidrug efflux pump subunit AcrA (membrane-fusion protein)